MKATKPTCLLLLSGLALSSCQNKEGDKDAGAPEGKIKNVVVVISDDHSYKTLGCYGNRHIRTQNMDRLAAEGMQFTNAYAQAALCSASRQSILSGKYPHATGVTLLFTPFPDHGNTTIAEVLQSEGYNTALIGKTHFNNFIWWDLYEDGFPDYGFDTLIGKQQYQQWRKENPMPELPADVQTRSSGSPFNKNTEYLPAPVHDSFALGTFYAREAVNFIENNREEPFFLWLAFNEPHAPFDFPVEYANAYDPGSLPLGKAGPEDPRWVPESFRDLTEKERRGIVASYYTSVEYMDKNLGIVLEALDRNDLTENTLVLYCTDQGYLLNEHGRFEKHTFWEESIKSPLIFRGPGIPKGTASDALVELLDLPPTIADVLGYPAYEDWQGESMVPLLTEEQESIKDHVFSLYLHDNMAMVATKKWKYIFHTGHHDLDIGYATGYGPSGIFHRLYNLEKDPHEFHNLAYEEACLDTSRYFRDLMLESFEKTHPYADECPEELNKLGKLVWYCEPRDAGATYGMPLNVTIRDSLRIDVYE